MPPCLLPDLRHHNNACTVGSLLLGSRVVVAGPRNSKLVLDLKFGAQCAVGEHWLHCTVQLSVLVQNTFVGLLGQVVFGEFRGEHVLRLSVATGCRVMSYKA